MWTLARTLSVLRRGKTAFAARSSPTISPSGTPPSGDQSHPTSILIPANQKALASRGFYLQHGWPQGVFEEDKPVAEDRSDPEDDVSKNAASRRKMFQKTRSRRNWSLCGSGDDDGKKSVGGANSGEWVTKSMDDSLNREDSTGADDTHGRLAYFSTTTESSTDSLDGKSFETEKALEEIRRQYNEGQVFKKERSSSEDLFVPNPNAHARFTEDSAFGDSAQNEEGDFLAARSNNYFISPATSRQATVEKSPSICDPSVSDLYYNNRPNDSNNNKNEVEEKFDKQKHSFVHFAKDVELKLTAGGHSISAPPSFDRSQSADTENGDSTANVNSDVQIIVSGSSVDSLGKELRQKSQSSDAPSSTPSHLAVKEGLQRASSDSGSSSSGTAVGSASVVTAGDDLDTLRTSESECSVTDRDSISRTNSPCGFLLAAPGARGRSEAKREMVSTACQASEQDLVETFAQASAAERDTGQNSSTVIKVKVMKKSNGGTEFVLEGEVGRPEGMENVDDGQESDSRRKRGMQLSPPLNAVDPLELMKRLRRSQEELPRMESIQSDSSGFGDADPAVEAVPLDGDTGKVQQVGSLGSSSESNGTLASSSTTTVGIQTRTGDMATQTVSETLLTDQRPRAQSENFQEKQQYITTCFIPSVADDPTPWQDYSRDDRERILTHRRQTSPNIMSYVSEIKYNVHDGSTGNRHFMDERNYGERLGHPSQSRFQGQQRFMPDNGTPLSRRTSVPYDHDYSYTPPIYSDPQRYRPRRFFSQYEVNVGSQNLSHHGQHISPTRNDIPLSQELANAPGFSQGNSVSPANVSPHSTKSCTVTTPEHQHTTSTPASASYVGKKGAGGNSITMYINPKEGDSSSSSHSLPPRFKTEASFSYQPISGNLSGMTNSSKRTTSSVSHSDQYADRESWRRRSCDILEDGRDMDFDNDSLPVGFNDEASNLGTGPRRLLAKRYSSPAGSLRSELRFYVNQNAQHSIPPPAASQTFDDSEANSSMGETGSEFSAQSYPEGTVKTGILDAQRLARLINKPVFIRGKRQAGSHYRPRRHFREWHALNRKKRLQEENRLLQHSIQKYKDELNTMEMSFMLDCQSVYDDLTDEEREEIDELEYLWEEVKVQVSEMERLLLSRVKSVNAGNDLHSFLSNLGVVNKTIELLKEQMYQHHVSTRRTEHHEEDYDSDQFYHQGSSAMGTPQERLTFLPSHTFMDDMMKGPHHHQHHHQQHRSFTHHAHSASLSSLPTNLNVSLDQIKSSLLKEIKDEMKASTQKLEVNLMEKDKEIQALKEQLESGKAHKEQKLPAKSKASTESPKRSWAPKTEIRGRGHRRSRSRIMGDRLVTETDV